MKTLAKPGSAKLTERRSRFFAFAFPVSSEEEIDRHLAELRRRYHDAHHIAYAWRLAGRERADDAGEPAGAAGRPILQLLRGQGLEGVLVAVVRYFGGVKLGVGGLARAYREAARTALAAAGVMDKVLRVQVKVRVPPERLGDALALAGRLDARIISQGYQETPTLELSLPEEALSALRAGLVPWGKLEEA